MKIYAVAKGEGKNLHTATTKFFTNRETAEKYLHTFDTVKPFYNYIFKDSETDEPLTDNAYIDIMTTYEDIEEIKKSIENRKPFDKKNRKYYTDIIFFEKVYNSYTLIEIEAE